MKTKTQLLALASAVVLFCGAGAVTASAQPFYPAAAPAYQPLSDQQLDQLFGPIALYPDPLLGEVLAAATFPAQIVMADRYISSGGSPDSTAQQGWDASVQAVAHYPEVLKYMDENLTWTTAVGEAFLYQQQQVMESIQRLRLSAQNYGNLVSTPQQQVVDDGGCVEILPADPDVIYVPSYQPANVYCQSGIGLGFGFGCVSGSWLNCEFDWAHHHLRHWDHDGDRPPDWWHQRPDQRRETLAGETTPWRHEFHGVSNGTGRNYGGANFNNNNNNNNSWATRRTMPSDFQARLERLRVHQQLYQQQFQQRFQQFQQQQNVARYNVQRTAPVLPRQNFGAYNWNAGSSQMRTFNGGVRQSPPTFTHSAPVQIHSAPVQTHSASMSHPSFSGGGGGGGFHGGGRH